MNVKMNNKGFSLVELMVVVAIIGILAAVAVPQFSKFQAKSKQSEAKASLSALYTAEKAFNSEYSGFGTNFRAIGYSPAGEVLYNVGFSAGHCAADWSNCAPQFAPGGVVSNAALHGGALFFDADGVCSATNATDAVMATTGCRMKSTGAANGAVGTILAVPAITAASQVAFTGAAIAQVYASYANNDIWTINQDKVIRNTTPGIP